MKSLTKTILIESCLLVFLIAWLIILLMSLGIISVSGFEIVQNIFKQSEDNTKFYGGLSIFGGVGFAIFYSMLMVGMYYIRAPRNLVYIINVGAYAISFAAVVVGLLLVFLNF